jgi:hypothetical protein
MDAEKWSKATNVSSDKQREIDEKLSPSISQMQYVISYARTIYECTKIMKNASTMAHEGLIDFELAQKILDVQKKNIERGTICLQEYLSD